jgi:hypothetical protein
MKRKALITARIALAAAPFWVGAASAVPPQGSSYYTDGQNSYVEDATSKGIGTVNMIACFIGAMRPDALVNEGNYVALVDEKKCDPNARSSASSSGASGGQDVPQYTRAVVNSTRASNSDPMIVKVWVASEMGQSNSAATIFVKATATEAPTATNPYGQFRLDFCGKFDGDASTNPCLMTGYIDAASTGLRFFQNEGDSQSQKVTQLTLTQGSGGDTGQGRLATDESSGGQSLTTTFSFAYDSSYYLRGDSVTNQNLCFSRLEAGAKKSVWRYGLYNDDGTHVEVNSGFPVTWVNPGDSKTYQGNMGYYGLWMDGNMADQVPNGATLTRQSFQQGAAGESYTLYKARGRLTKYTRQSTKLDHVTNVRMNVSMQVNNQWQQIEVYWDGTQFVKSAVMTCGQNGCNTQSVNPVEPIANSTWASFGGIFGWSQSLGGEVFIKDVANLATPAMVDVVYRVQGLVFPGEAPASLQCIGECPDAASMTSFFTNQGATSPFAASTLGASYNPMGVAAGNLVSYVQDATTGELKVAGDSTPLVITDATWLANNPQYSNGLMSGKLFDANDDANVRCDADSTKYCGAKLNDLATYYQWQTGTQSYNEFFALRAPSGNCAGSTDAFCRFDPPMSITYSVPNDSNEYGVYAGQDVILQYGGFGNLWGIPGTCVNRYTNATVDCNGGGQDVRWVSAFSIPFDTTAGRLTRGSTAYYARWLDREVRFSVAPSGCTGLSLPASLTLPTAAGSLYPGVSTSANYIGTAPVVTDAPRVIHGEVKY